MSRLEVRGFDERLNPISLPSTGGTDFRTRIGTISNDRAGKVQALETELEEAQETISNLRNQLAAREDAYAALLAEAREVVQKAYDKGVQDVIDYLRDQGVI